MYLCSDGFEMGDVKRDMGSPNWQDSGEGHKFEKSKQSQPRIRSGRDQLDIALTDAEVM